MATLDKTKLTALLGRSLSIAEDENFDLYLDIAKLRLENLTCLKLDELDEIASDLALVWALLFGSLGESQKTNSGVASKRVEDFQIQYHEGYDPLVDVIDKNIAIIAKYSKCPKGIRHGSTIFDTGELEYDSI